MPMLLRILAAFRADQIDQAGLLSRVQALAAEPKADVAAMIDALQADHSKVPLPASVFAAVLRQLQTSTDKTLLRTRDAALAFILGDTTGNTGPRDTQTGDVTQVLADPAAVARAVAAQPAYIRTLIGRFGLVELAGEGGMSRVYKAVDQRKVEAGSDDPHVAVKVLNIPFEDVNDATALLHREMRHLHDLVHPNIVRVFDCDRDGETVFMTMEFLAGTTLTRKVRAPNFTGVNAMEALPISRSVADALEFAHAKRIVHGDLTPGNVMLATSGVVKVIDFGIARINFVFAQTDLTKFKHLLYTQLCELAGGPCIYEGRDMRTAHAKLPITNAQFNALAEDLYIALDRVGVSYALQNEMIALLAPMQRDIVKR